MIHNWSEEQAGEAKKQGWLLAEVWDGRKLEVAILRDDDAAIFATNAEARRYVSGRCTHAHDPLACDALRLMMGRAT
jgi:hypothetical protein